MVLVNGVIEISTSNQPSRSSKLSPELYLSNALYHFELNSTIVLLPPSWAQSKKKEEKTILKYEQIGPIKPSP